MFEFRPHVLKKAKLFFCRLLDSTERNESVALNKGVVKVGSNIGEVSFMLD